MKHLKLLLVLSIVSLFAVWSMATIEIQTTTPRVNPNGTSEIVGTFRMIFSAPEFGNPNDIANTTYYVLVRVQMSQGVRLVNIGGLDETEITPVNFVALALEKDAGAPVFPLLDPNAVRQQVWSQMTEELVRAIVTFLTGKRLRPAAPSDDDLGNWFFNNSLHSTHPQLETRFRLRQPIVGIGAPAGIFLPKVAEVLHTDLVLPEHYEVANAVGAVAGSVMVAEEILVYPRLSSSGLEVLGYYVQTSEDRREFEEVEPALAYARDLGRERALGAAIRSGADNPRVIVEEATDGLDTCRIRAKAFGNPRLG